MKRLLSLALVLSILALAGCGASQSQTAADTAEEAVDTEAVSIVLSDDGVQVEGGPATDDPEAAVYIAHDIVYYEEGKDFTYGEGTEADAHSAEEAAAHTVVHITQPGTYALSGQLSQGQVAVDLGEEAEEDPNAVVTLVLDGVDITCTVAPAIIFYSVYECGDKDNATKDVDTAAAGANVVIADGTTNTVNGSYVARIYKPDSVELSEDGTEVADAKKLHKYDAAFYSKMSMNVNGGQEGTGVLNIDAENEGMDTELHLSVNGGTINITSGNDGINTNEDGVSVTAINGGDLTIQVTGETGEGDGIDSNGWLVINGGTVIAASCSDSQDAGIDSDMGIHINGGTVMATGHMLDHIEAGGQTYAVFNFAQTQSGDQIISLKNAAEEELMALWPKNDYTCLVYSSPDLTAGEYTLWSDGVQLAHGGAGMGGFRPSGTGGPQLSEDFDPSQFEMGERPEGFGEKTPREGMEMPEQGERPEMPEGVERSRGGQMSRSGGSQGQTAEQTTVFTIADGENNFSGITTLTA